MDTHRHRWSVAGFRMAGGRPIMAQSCDCGATGSVLAWDRSWDGRPQPAWRLADDGAGAPVAGRLLEMSRPGPMTNPAQAISIDVWADIACPWCYIGKRNLERSLEALGARGEAVPVEVDYHSFELSPDTPAEFEGSSVDYLVQTKGISREQAHAMNDRVTALAAEAGLDYNMDAVKHTGTVKAHQLVHFAKARGLQSEAVERLSRAYFVEGRHIGRDEELGELAAEIGLDPAEALRSLRADEYLGDVRADETLAAAYGIRGVPFFLIDGRYALSGAQPPETFAAALQHVARERTPAGPA